MIYAMIFKGLELYHKQYFYFKFANFKNLAFMFLTVVKYMKLQQKFGTLSFKLVLQFYKPVGGIKCTCLFLYIYSLINFIKTCQVC